MHGSLMSLFGATAQNIYKFDTDRSKNPAFQSHADWILCQCSKKAIYLSPKKNPGKVAQLLGAEVVLRMPAYIAWPQ